MGFAGSQGYWSDEEEDELERLAGYYKHSDNWQNRLIQGDSLLVMNSLLNREGMKTTSFPIKRVSICREGSITGAWALKVCPLPPLPRKQPV